MNQQQYESRKMKRTIALIVTLGFGTAMVATAADVNENWDKNCKICHGAEGKGDSTMGKKLSVKDMTDAKVQADLKDDAAFKFIKEGVKEGDSIKMKAFGEILSDAEIKALVQKVRGFKK
jgi:mono/diheme cytochrome c family protein